jgi:hypothetical protein
LSKDAPVDSAIPSHVVSLFQHWIAKHNKAYERPEELVHRLKIFFENYLYVTEMNSKSTGSLVLSLNKFADLHTDEFSPPTSSEGHLAGLKNLKKQNYLQKDTQSLKQSSNPEEFNWETNGSG